MRHALLLVWVLLLPILLVLAAVVGAVQGEWGAAGVCALLGVLLAGSRLAD